MKYKINAILLLIAFPLLLIGGNESIIGLSLIGIVLLFLAAGIVLVKPLLSHRDNK